MEIQGLINKAHTNAKEKLFWEAIEEWNALKNSLAETVRESITSETKREGLLHMLDRHDKEFRQYAKATRLMLIVTELAEATEAIRNGEQANHDEEIADVVIRLGDYCGGYGVDLEQAITRKMLVNENRPILHGKEF